MGMCDFQLDRLEMADSVLRPSASPMHDQGALSTARGTAADGRRHRQAKQGPGSREVVLHERMPRVITGWDRHQVAFYLAAIAVGASAKQSENCAARQRRRSVTTPSRGLT